MLLHYSFPFTKLKSFEVATLHQQDLYKQLNDQHTKIHTKPTADQLSTASSVQDGLSAWTQTRYKIINELQTSKQNKIPLPALFEKKSTCILACPAGKCPCPGLQHLGQDKRHLSCNLKILYTDAARAPATLKASPQPRWCKINQEQRT